MTTSDGSPPSSAPDKGSQRGETLPSADGSFFYSAARVAVRTTMRLGSRPTVEGLEHIPADGAVILASNHLSFIDSIVIPCVVPRRVTFLAKSDYFTGPGVKGAIVKAWFETNGVVPVYRSGAADESQATLQAALSVLGEGFALGVYPEGTRSRDGKLYRGRVGVSWLALTSGCPVVPVGLIGTNQVMPIGSTIPRPKKLTVRFAPALLPADYAGAGAPGKARRAFTDDLMNAIGVLTGQERVGHYNERPPED